MESFSSFFNYFSSRAHAANMEFNDTFRTVRVEVEREKCTTEENNSS